MSEVNPFEDMTDHEIMIDRISANLRSYQDALPNAAKFALLESVGEQLRVLIESERERLLGTNA